MSEDNTMLMRIEHAAGVRANLGFGLRDKGVYYCSIEVFYAFERTCMPI